MAQWADVNNGKPAGSNLADVSVIAGRIDNIVKGLDGTNYLSAVDIDGGTIDGVSIGAATPATISATTVTTTGIVSVDDTTQSTSTTTGSIHTDGGLGVVKNVYLGGTLNVTGTITGSLTGNVTGNTSGSSGSCTGNSATATSATTAGTVTTAAQTAITSVGTLTELQIDNLNINGNTIISSDTNGNINITPNGTGKTVIATQKYSGVIAIGSTAITAYSNGVGDELQASSYVALKTCTLRQIGIYLGNNHPTSVVMGIYSDNSGYPGSLLAQCTALNFDTADEYNTRIANFNSEVDIIQGTRYWLTRLLTGTLNSAINVNIADTRLGYSKALSYTGTLPANFPASGSGCPSSTMFCIS